MTDMTMRDAIQEKVRRALYSLQLLARNLSLRTDFVEFVAPLFFLRCLYLLSRAARADALEGRRAQLGDYELPADACFGLLYEKIELPGNVERLERALSALRGHSAILRELFSESENVCLLTRGNKQQERLFGEVLAVFQAVTVDEGISIGNHRRYVVDLFRAFVEQLGQLSLNARKEVYATPELTRLVSNLVQLQHTESICDPYCRDGSLLFACVEQVARGDLSEVLPMLGGKESNHSQWQLATMQAFLRGYESDCIELGDSLLQPIIEKGALKRFDVVVAFPPVSDRGLESALFINDRFQRFELGMPPRGRLEYAYLQHMLAMLSDHGRMIVVVPAGALFRTGAELPIRRHLVESGLIEAVIELPSRVIAGTGITFAILILNKQGLPRYSVRLINASPRSPEDRRAYGLTEEQAEDIHKLYFEGGDGSQRVRKVPLEELAANQYNLLPSRYIGLEQEAAPEVDVGAALERQAVLFNQLTNLRAEMANLLKDEPALDQ